MRKFKAILLILFSKNGFQVSVKNGNILTVQSSEYMQVAHYLKIIDILEDDLEKIVERDEIDLNINVDHYKYVKEI